MFVPKSGNKNANDHNFSAVGGGGGGGVTVCNVMGNRSGRMLTMQLICSFSLTHQTEELLRLLGGLLPFYVIRLFATLSTLSVWVENGW